MYKHDTTTKFTIDSAVNWPADGVVRVDDGTEWVLQRYDLLTVGPPHELDTLTDPKAIFESSGAVGHEFAIGTTVTLVFTGDYLDELVPSTPILADGSQALTANWDAGAFQIRALKFYSDVATGTAPLTVASTTVVPNLNADMVDGHHFADAILAAGTVPLTAAWDAGPWQIRAETFRSDVVTGTAPFTVASTTKVVNLNADLLDGAEAASWVLASGATPLTGNWDVGAFKITALTFESDVATGTAPLTVASTTMVDNLNVELVQGVALTAAELGELANIGATTISAAQWGYLGALTGEPLEVDGTAGRIIRRVWLSIDDGTNAATLKCALTSRWNGDTIGETDNVAKDATTGNFTLDANGLALKVEASGLTGNAVMAFGVISHNVTGLDGLTVLCNADTNDLYILTRDGGVNQDLTTLVDTGKIYVEILYITDA